MSVFTQISERPQIYSFIWPPPGLNIIVLAVYMEIKYKAEVVLPGDFFIFRGKLLPELAAADGDGNFVFSGILCKCVD